MQMNGKRKGAQGMTRKEWENLKRGDKIIHQNGDVEIIYEWDGEKYIDGEKSLFPLSEFNYKEWEILKA